jgi:hypothetical protein
VASDDDKDPERESADDDAEEAAHAADSEARDEDDSDADDQEVDSDEDDAEDSDDDADREDDDESAEDESVDRDDDEDEPKPSKKRAPLAASPADDDAPAPAKAPKKSVRKVKGLTPGERLAQAKAAKAARKMKERGRDADRVESMALKKAGEAGQWVERNRKLISIGLGAIIVALAGYLGFKHFSSMGDEDASKLLWEAVETANARIRGEDTPAPEDEEEPSFATIDERAEAAIDEYAKLDAEHGDSEAAVWADLGRGHQLLALERYDDARGSFRAALDRGGSEAFVAYRAIEGIAFAFEAEEKWDEAIDQFTQLGQTEGGRYELIADYHLARMHLAKGETERAKELLSELIGKLDSEPEEGSEAPLELPYVEAQARARLSELDPSFAQRSAPSLGDPGFQLPGGQQIPPELLEKILGGGGGGGAP